VAERADRCHSVGNQLLRNRELQDPLAARPGSENRVSFSVFGLPGLGFPLKFPCSSGLLHDDKRGSKPFHHRI
jgi:hypothetical protein